MIEHTIEDIAEALGPHGAAPRRCSVLLGAGCSISAGIPSASDIVRHIKTTFPAAYARAASHDYPDCMAALERGVRRDLIGAYIDKARINCIRSVPRVADEGGPGAYIWSSRWLGSERVATSGRGALIAGRTAG